MIFLPEKPDDFKMIQKDAENMGFFELRKYTKKIQSEGYDTTRYRADLYGKIAFPFVTIILVFIGVFFTSFGKKRRHNAKRGYRYFYRFFLFHNSCIWDIFGQVRNNSPFGSLGSEYYLHLCLHLFILQGTHLKFV